MAKSQINFGELGGGGIESIESFNESWTLNVPLQITTTKKAKGICFSIRYNTTSYGEELVAFDGLYDNVIQSTISTYTGKAIFTDNYIELQAITTSATNFTAYGYILY